MNNDIEIQKDDEDVEPEEGSSEYLEAKLKKIKMELKVCQQEKGEYLAGWQRARADFINARRDEEKNRIEHGKCVEEKLLRDMLVIADSIEIAQSHKASAGIEPIFCQLKELLKRYGVVPMESVNQAFDPARHEAISQIETAKQGEDGIILQELQKGYMMNDRVLRPSKVKVGTYQIK